MSDKKIQKPQFNFTWFFIIAGAVLIFFTLFGGETTSLKKEVIYSELKSYIEKGYVSDITVYDNNDVEAKLYPDSAKYVFPGKVDKIGEEPMIFLQIGSKDNFEKLFQHIKNKTPVSIMIPIQDSFEIMPITVKNSDVIYNFIEEIDRRYLDSISKQNPNWSDIWHNTAILWAGQVRMANLSIIAGHAVNGVAELHTKILKEAVLHDFYTLQPDKFSNKTNGITHRRFLAQANQPFSKLITSTIGDKWMTDASELEKLDDYTSNDVFLKDLAKCKLINKQHLADYVMKTTGIVIDPNSIFDIQVKRFHAYKRQLLNLFKVMNIYNQLLEDPSLDITPTTFIFAGKAAQGYEFAKEVIRLVNSVADVINNDSRVNDRIRVAFIPNFSVSNAQVIYPAADISEQISTAGLEASGTGNMKFMMNGAITLGTLDGSTVEIAERVGANAIEIFGLRAEEIMSYKQNHSYIALNEYNANQDLKIVVDQLVNNTFSKLSGNFNVIYDTLLRTNDEFFVLKDFDSYINSWNHLNHLYKDSIHWNRISLHNTAQSGYFSSDRTIKQYADEIWHL